ncbi:hypothetical protein [Facklamia hominis]|uniref:Uncharacterized protein n=1 Tax=Facklamia hominis TaxID=178214 RepID=A0AAJ1Q4H5_9LACT|nr:hypothetical protein [Facklamia hominis]MDK7187507.1 hypothetical protein [Facklamia hominis]
MSTERARLALDLPNEFYDSFQLSIQEIYQQAIEQARADLSLNKEFLAVPELRKQLGMSFNTFKTNVEDKGIPIYLLGNKKYIKRTDLFKFMEQHRIN